MLDTPAKVMIAVVAIMLGGELLITLLIESFHSTLLKDVILKKWLLEIIDPIALTSLVSLALYLLIFKPITAKQAELERQLDELRRFQKVIVRRELHMKELAEELAALCAIRLPSKKPTLSNSRPVLWKNHTMCQSNPESSH